MDTFYMTVEETKKLKLTEIELLNELDRVCKLLNLEYYMVGGTLLGAVRHKGFIPWDDDIDVVMYRKDLDILEENGKELFDKKYFLQTENTDKYYPLMTSKLRKNDTVFLESCMDENVKSHVGAFIDIFPMDDISDIKNKKVKIRVKIMDILTTVLCENCGYHYDIKKRTKVFSKIFGVLGIERLKRIRRICMTYENGKGLETNTIYASNYGYIKQFRDKKTYYPAVELEFEGKYYMAPNKYFDFLKQLFGENYMELPPVEKRITRHPVLKIDLGEEPKGIEKNDK